MLSKNKIKEISAQLTHSDDDTALLSAEREMHLRKRCRAIPEQVSCCRLFFLLHEHTYGHLSFYRFFFYLFLFLFFTSAKAKKRRRTVRDTRRDEKERERPVPCYQSVPFNRSLSLIKTSQGPRRLLCVCPFFSSSSVWKGEKEENGRK